MEEEEGGCALKPNGTNIYTSTTIPKPLENFMFRLKIHRSGHGQEVKLTKLSKATAQPRMTSDFLMDGFCFKCTWLVHTTPPASVGGHICSKYPVNKIKS